MMISKSIRWRLSLSYASIALLAALLLGAIMLAVLQQYYTDQEIDYLTQNAVSMAQIVADAQSNDMPSEVLEQVLEGFAFFSNTQIHLLGLGGEILLDTGPPQERTILSFSEMSSIPMGFGFTIESSLPITTEENPDEIIGFPESMGEVVIIDSGTMGFPGWMIGSPIDESQIQSFPDTSQPRSRQVVQYPVLLQDGNLFGTLQLSNGPAYGRDILRSVARGWALAALTAVLLAAAAGTWVSRRFSTPLESLTHTTAVMAAGDLSARATLERQDEFGQLANSFNQMAETIETKVKTLRRFVADAAHELGTPLTALRTNLELLDDTHIPIALEQVQRMDELTSSLLALSQLEAVDLESQFEDVDLAALLRELSEPYASQAEQAELSFNLEITGDSHLVKGAPAQLGTLVKNLLDNAIKFTPLGGHVYIELGEDDDVVQLTVADTGIGIPEDEISELFSRFHRGRNASGFPGSGLGLAIVKAITDQHQATIEVESKPAGTAFVIRFSGARHIRQH